MHASPRECVIKLTVLSTNVKSCFVRAIYFRPTTIKPSLIMAQDILRHLYDNQLVMDVSLKVPNDSRQIKAHRNILIGASKHFEERFTGLWSYMEAVRPVITIQGMNYETLECLIKLIYTGTFELTDKATIKGAVVAAHYLGMATVMDKLSDHIANTSVHWPNLIELYSVSEKLTPVGASALRRRILENIHLLYKDTCNLSVQKFKEVLQEHIKYPVAEETILKAIKAWIEAVPGNERYALDLLSCVVFRKKVSVKKIM